MAGRNERLRFLISFEGRSHDLARFHFSIKPTKAMTDTSENTPGLTKEPAKREPGYYRVKLKPLRGNIWIIALYRSHDRWVDPAYAQTVADEYWEQIDERRIDATPPERTREAEQQQPDTDLSKFNPYTNLNYGRKEAWLEGAKWANERAGHPDELSIDKHLINVYKKQTECAQESLSKAQQRVKELESVEKGLSIAGAKLTMVAIKLAGRYTHQEYLDTIEEVEQEFSKRKTAQP